MTIAVTLLFYLLALAAYSRLATKGTGDNNVFFRAGRKSPWYMVAFGMVGASISGVTFVSVPGMVNTSGMTYLQTCLGFIVGYAVVAFVLLPAYYNHNLTSIYSLLDRRMGKDAHKAGATVFLVSKMMGAAVKFYVVCLLLQRYALDAAGVPFAATVIVLVGAIWLYTRRGGINTLVRTDALQTACMFAALILILYHVVTALGMTPGEAVDAVRADSRSAWLALDNPLSKQYFWKQFLSGVFIVIVMTGLDQDMMQKNLTCKSLRDARKDMCCYGLAFLPTNLLFLSLGVLLSLLCRQQGIDVPAKGDELLPMFAATGAMGQTVVVLFTIGIAAASLSTADSAMTAMTTSYCVDILGNADDERLRRRTHAAVGALFALVVIAVDVAGTDGLIDTIYTLCAYTYGPLLGLFAYAFIHKNKKSPPRGRLVWVVCIGSPIVCFALDHITAALWNYRFGYELLMANGALTYLGLVLAAYGRRSEDTTR